MNPIVIIEGTAYRISEDNRLETLNVGNPVLGKFEVTSPESRNMTGDQDHRIKEALKVFNFLFPDNRKVATHEKSMRGKTEKPPARLPREFGVGAKSEYVCNICTKSILTVDRATGEVWPKIPCNQTRACRGSMIGYKYQGREKAQYEWRQPTDQEIALAGEGSYEQDYLKRGGLKLVPIEGAQAPKETEPAERPAKVMRSRRAKLGLEV